MITALLLMRNMVSDITRYRRLYRVCCSGLLVSMNGRRLSREGLMVLSPDLYDPLSSTPFFALVDD